jgi:hypothetical protein
MGLGGDPCTGGDVSSSVVQCPKSCDNSSLTVGVGTHAHGAFDPGTYHPWYVGNEPSKGRVVKDEYSRTLRSGKHFLASPVVYLN